MVSVVTVEHCPPYSQVGKKIKKISCPIFGGFQRRMTRPMFLCGKGAFGDNFY
jgi:hypothetical protein